MRFEGARRGARYSAGDRSGNRQLPVNTPEASILLIFFKVDRFFGNPELGFRTIAWVVPRIWPSFDFLDGDVEFVARSWLSGPSVDVFLTFSNIKMLR